MSGQTTIDRAAKDQAVAWIVLLDSGRCTEADRLAFQRWLDADETHRIEYEAARDYWDSLGQMPLENSAALLEARNYRSGSHRRYLALAASLLITITVGVASWVQAPSPSPVITYATLKGEQKSIVLEDGTKVDLNTNTRLRVSYSAEIRAVEIEKGEALFTIAGNEKRPFEATAGKGRIRDIGTAFCVHLEDEQVSLTVIEGLVLIDTDTLASPLRVSAGHYLSYDMTGALIDSRAVDTTAHTAWKNGRFIFKGASIDELSRQIMRYYDVNVIVDHAALDDLRISGNFKINDLDGLLSALGMMLPVDITHPDTKTIRFSLKNSS